MPLKKNIIHSHIFDADAFLPFLDLNNPVHQKKRITVGQNPHNAVNVNFLFVSPLIFNEMSLFLIPFLLLINLLEELNVQGVPAFKGKDMPADRSAQKI